MRAYPRPCTAALRLRVRAPDELDERLYRGVGEAIRGEWEGKERARNVVGRVRQLGAAERALQGVVPVATSAVHGGEAPLEDAYRAERVAAAARGESVWTGPTERR